MAEAQIIAQKQNKRQITPVDRYQSKDFKIKKSKAKRNLSKPKPKRIFEGHKESFRRKDELRDEIRRSNLSINLQFLIN